MGSKRVTLYAPEMEKFFKVIKLTFFNTIHSAISQLSHTSIYPLPKRLIISKSSSHTKKLFKKNINSLYFSYKLLPKDFELSNQNDLLRSLLNMTVKEAYINFVSSKTFEIIFQNMITTKGEEYSKKYKAFSLLFIHYLDSL